MNKHSRSILLFCLVTVTVLASGCGAVTAVSSPTLTLVPSQTPTATATPSPTKTPKPVLPEGILVYTVDRNMYSRDNNIYVVDIKSRNVWMVSSNNGSWNWIFIKDDTIYYTRDDNGERINWNGSGFEQLFSNGLLLSVSPDQDYVLYSSGNAICVDFVCPNTLTLLDLQSKTSKIIAKEYKYRFVSCSPPWSPDSSWFIFCEEDPFNTDTERLFLYNINENKTVELLPDKIIYKGLPRIPSPDGKYVVLNLGNEDGSQSQIYLLNIESGELDLLSKNESYARSYGYAWSQDGKKLNVAIWRKDQVWIDIMDLQNGQEDRIGIGNSAYRFSWSPNGDKVLYEVDEGGSTNRQSLYLLDLNSQKLEKIYSQNGLLQGGTAGIRGGHTRPHGHLTENSLHISQPRIQMIIKINDLLF